MNRPNEIENIVIAGGGTAGWLAAALFAVHMPNVSVRLIESEDIGTIGVGESTIPPFLGLIRNLGINEQDFIAKTQASFKLGIRFPDWREKGHAYFHPFGQIGQPIDGNDFYHCWLKAKMAGHTSELQDFAPASVMADQGRFMLPFKAPQSPIGTASYALHVDAKRVAQYLRRHAEAHGVRRTEGMVAGVDMGVDGNIRSLTLKSGEVVTGDLFIDCTGFRALLIGGAMGVGYESWAEQLLCNRAVVCQTENAGPPPPYTIAHAQDFGWRWRIPLQTRAGNGYVFSSDHISDAEATEVLLSQIEGKVLTDPMIVPFTTGIRKKVWQGNCLSLGLASGFIEPLESTAIHLVYRTLDFFFRYFPDKTFDPALQADFNRRIYNDYEEIKDFIILHYCVSQRRDTEFWRRVTSLPIPESLKTRIDVFRASGTLREVGPDELFRSPSWYSVFEGMGVRPSRYNVLTDRLDTDDLKRLLDQVKPRLDGFVRTLPMLQDFLDGFCPAAA
jgi:tryptophan halogenase